MGDMENSSVTEYVIVYRNIVRYRDIVRFLGKSTDLTDEETDSG